MSGARRLTWAEAQQAKLALQQLGATGLELYHDGHDGHAYEVIAEGPWRMTIQTPTEVGYWMRQVIAWTRGEHTHRPYPGDPKGPPIQRPDAEAGGGVSGDSSEGIWEPCLHLIR